MAGGAGIRHIATFTETYADQDAWGSVSAPDVTSVAQPGDLIVIAFSFDRDPSAFNSTDWDWAADHVSFTFATDATEFTNPGTYVGHTFYQAGDDNPYVDPDWTGTRWTGISLVCSVFRGVNSFLANGIQSASTGLPNPPSLTAAGKLWIVTGHLDDDRDTTLTPPTPYTLAGRAQASGIESTVAVGYRIEELSSDDPGAFTGSGDDENDGIILAFD